MNEFGKHTWLHRVIVCGMMWSSVMWEKLGRCSIRIFICLQAPQRSTLDVIVHAKKKFGDSVLGRLCNEPQGSLKFWNLLSREWFATYNRKWTSTEWLMGLKFAKPVFPPFLLPLVVQLLNFFLLRKKITEILQLALVVLFLEFGIEVSKFFRCVGCWWLIESCNEQVNLLANFFHSSKTFFALDELIKVKVLWGNVKSCEKEIKVWRWRRVNTFVLCNYRKRGICENHGKFRVSWNVASWNFVGRFLHFLLLIILTRTAEPTITNHSRHQHLHQPSFYNRFLCCKENQFSLFSLLVLHFPAVESWTRGKLAKLICSWGVSALGLCFFFGVAF